LDKGGCIKYTDFVDLKYRPKKSDVVCEFYVEPRGISLKKAAGAVAAESSIGTWTELTTMHKYVERLRARVYEIKGHSIKVAYPLVLFELGNMPNILSSVAGNVFGLKELKNLRLNDIQLPRQLVQSFKGPRFGIEGIRKVLKIEKRPLIGTIIKPKLGLKTKHHAKVAYDAWIGGCDIVKDDENLSSQSFNIFSKRIVQTLNARDRAEQETGERKVYMPNITAETDEMIRRAKFVRDHGGRYAMVDVLTVGWAALQTLREHSLVLHAHRAMHAAITKNAKHGIAMKVFAKLLRVVGMDQLHVGAGVGKMFETKEEVLANVDALKQRLYGLKPVMPVASGGLHPALVPELVKLFGNDVIIQAGGGVHGHPMGTMSGAKAFKQAVCAVAEGITLKECAKKHKELRLAIKKWH